MPETDHFVKMSAKLCMRAAEDFRAKAAALEAAAQEQCPGYVHEPEGADE